MLKTEEIEPGTLVGDALLLNGLFQSLNLRQGAAIKHVLLGADLIQGSAGLLTATLGQKPTRRFYTVSPF